MKKNQLLISILAAFFFVCILGACSVQHKDNYELSDVNNIDPAENVEVIPFGEGNFGILADYEGFATLESFCEVADNVVVGYYVDSEPEKWNMSRNPTDPSKESDYIYTEGLLYEFIVVDALKGDCVPGESITINIEHGLKATSGKKVRVYESEVYYEPQFEELVVLGLDRDIYYYAAGYPFEMRFEKPILKEAMGSNFSISDFYNESLVVISPEDFHSVNTSKSSTSKGFESDKELIVSSLLKNFE